MLTMIMLGILTVIIIRLYIGMHNVFFFFLHRLQSHCITTIRIESSIMVSDSPNYPIIQKSLESWMPALIFQLISTRPFIFSFFFFLPFA